MGKHRRSRLGFNAAIRINELEIRVHPCRSVVSTLQLVKIPDECATRFGVDYFIPCTQGSLRSSATWALLRNAVGIGERDARSMIGNPCLSVSLRSSSPEFVLICENSCLNLHFFFQNPSKKRSKLVQILEIETQLRPIESGLSG